MFKPAISWSFVVACTLAAFAAAVAQPPTGSAPQAQTPPASVPTETANPRASKAIRPLDVLPKATRDAIGIDAMTDAQKNALEGLVVSLAEGGSLARAAEAYMDSEGFRRASVSAPTRAKLEEFDIEREWIVVDCGVMGTWAVEPPFGWTGRAGKYWARVNAAGPSSIVDTLGSERRVSFGRVKELR
jgi:hypothetical protein